MTIALSSFTALDIDDCYNLTFKARTKGVLVIDPLDIICEEEIANEWLDIKYKFRDQYNSVNFQKVQSDSEKGRWKFGRIILVDADWVTIEICNTNPLAKAYVSYEARVWSM